MCHAVSFQKSKCYTIIYTDDSSLKAKKMIKLKCSTRQNNYVLRFEPSLGGGAF